MLRPDQSLGTASTPASQPTPGALLPGTLASPRTGLSPAGCRELVERLRHNNLVVVMAPASSGRTRTPVRVYAHNPRLPMLCSWSLPSCAGCQAVGTGSAVRATGVDRGGRSDAKVHRGNVQPTSSASVARVVVNQPAFVRVLFLPGPRRRGRGRRAVVDIPGRSPRRAHDVSQ